MIRAPCARIAAAAGAGLLVACTPADPPADVPADAPPDPCAAAATCLDLEVRSYVIQTIDQLELDVVIAGQHAAGSPIVTGTIGKTVDLPTSLHLALDLPGPPVIQVDFIAAGKLGGSVLGLDADSIMVQQGHQASVPFLLEPGDPCVEGKLYCGGTGNTAAADARALYRCIGGVPIFYGRCSWFCSNSLGPTAECFGGGGPCREGGTYCGGDVVNGDPNTLYVCGQFGGMNPMPCPSGCALHDGGNDACQ